MANSYDRSVEEVIAAERRWVQAHRDLDLESYRSGKRRSDHAESDQYRVTVIGNSAILVGRWIGRGENDGEPFDYTARFMAFYVNRDGKWLLAADQSTPL